MTIPSTSGVRTPEADSAAAGHLRLYISGMTPRSSEAIATLGDLCEHRLAGRWALEIIDLYEHPELAAADGVRVAPTLVRTRPAPARRIIGDLTDAQRIVDSLQLDTPNSTSAPGKTDAGEPR